MTWLLLLILLFIGSQPMVVQADNNATTSSLTMSSKLKIEKNFVSASVAEKLYQDLMEGTVPGPYDDIEDSLIAINGDAGSKLDLDSNRKRIRKFREIVNNKSDERESGILRIEHMKSKAYEQANKLINDVVPNRVLEDEGSIHVYLSRPHSSALKNHTDTTHIFVLQLHGAKEWLLCEEEQTFYTKSRKAKLDKCSTYDDVEIDDLVCRKETLFPGDALYLPKRVVHSARATDDGLSAHLTFGFQETTCSENPEFGFIPDSHISRYLSCSASSGGTSCDSSCDGSCNCFCDCSCDSYSGYSSCDSCCNGCCNSSCDDSCDSNCAISLAAGTVVGIVLGILFPCIGVAVLVCFLCHRNRRGTGLPPNPHVSTSTEMTHTTAAQAYPAYPASAVATAVPATSTQEKIIETIDAQGRKTVTKQTTETDANGVTTVTIETTLPDGSTTTSKTVQVEAMESDNADSFVPPSNTGPTEFVA